MNERIKSLEEEKEDLQTKLKTLDDQRKDLEIEKTELENENNKRKTASDEEILGLKE